MNAELALDQVLPGVAFFIEVMANAQALIDAGEIVADELASVVRDQLFPKSPAQQRLKIDVQNYTDLLFRRERAGEDGAGETLQQRAGI